MNFRKKYWFLSNFYPVKIIAWGIEFPTLENAYVACKTDDMNKKRHIATLTPGQAKRYGRELELKSDWEETKVQCMLALLRRKFTVPYLAKLLLAVDEPIVEDNSWGDRFWGVYNDKGRNELGKLLEQVKKESQK